MNGIKASAFYWSIAGLLIGVSWGYWGEQTATNAQELSSRKNIAKPTPAKPYIQSTTKPSEASKELQLLRRIANASREDLEALCNELGPEAKNHGLMNSVFDRWVELDPLGGFELALSGKLMGRNEKQTLWNYMGRWALVDPDTAVAKTLALPEQKDINVAVSRICHDLAVRRPRDFLRLYTELKKGHDADSCFPTAIRKLATLDPEEAKRFFETFPAEAKQKAKYASDTERDLMIASLAAGWASSNPEASIAWAKGLDNETERNRGLLSIAEAIALERPEIAAQLLKAEDGSISSASLQALNRIAKNWSHADPETTMAWLQTNFGSKGTDVAKTIVADHIPHDSTAAIDYIVRHMDLLGLRGTIPWVPDDIPSGLAKAGEIPDETQRDTVLTYFLTALAQESPQQAMQATTTSLTNEGSKGSIFGVSIKQWAMQDITAASDWLAAQPLGRLRDDAINGLLPVIKKLEPESALQWATAYSSPESRQDAVASQLRAQSKGDQVVIDQILDELKLSDEDKTAIQQKLKPKPKVIK